MNWRPQNLIKLPAITLIAVSLMIFGINVQVSAQAAGSDCSQLKTQWEEMYQELKNKADAFAAVEQLPIERIIKKPIVNPNESKTIAAQVSSALQLKEDLLTAQRTEIRSLISSETRIFNELQSCIQADKSSKNKDINAISKKRRALLDRLNVTLAEVKEVEGRETVMPYSEAAGYDQYRRSVYNQWMNQDQRRWWGY